VFANNEGKKEEEEEASDLLAAIRATGTHDCTNFYPFKENISLKIYIFHGNKTDEHPRPTIP